jgi:hypothetical protein
MYDKSERQDESALLPKCSSARSCIISPCSVMVCRSRLPLSGNCALQKVHDTWGSICGKEYVGRGPRLAWCSLISSTTPSPEIYSRLLTTLFLLVMRKEYFYYPERDSYAEHYF